MLNINKVLSSEFGAIVVSILLGVGLAALFKTACKDGKCIVINSPPSSETDKYFYKVNDDCYKYSPVAAECQNQH